MQLEPPTVYPSTSLCQYLLFANEIKSNATGDEAQMYCQVLPCGENKLADRYHIVQSLLKFSTTADRGGQQQERTLLIDRSRCKNMYANRLLFADPIVNWKNRLRRASSRLITPGLDNFATNALLFAKTVS